MTYNEAKKDARYMGINTTGNRKLKNNNSVRFIIWNLPAQKTCPFATEHCKKFCYAKKAERVYPQVFPAREKNYSDSLSADFVKNMIFTIETELNTNKYKNKKVVFRIHESGDFYNLEYAEKWVKIARYFEDNKNLVFLAYTKSITYFINCGYGLNFPNNFIIRSSLWDDTSADKVELTNCYNIPVYTALTLEDMGKERAVGHVFYKCRCEDCATCGLCWTKQAKDIICEIHQKRG